MADAHQRSAARTHARTPKVKHTPGKMCHFVDTVNPPVWRGANAIEHGNPEAPAVRLKRLIEAAK